MSVKIAYLGPPGTFTEEAATRFGNTLAKPYNLKPFGTITASVEAVDDNECGCAVVPLENSLEGSVHETLDVLTTSLELMILAELVLDINHSLLVTPNYKGSLTYIYSHPQALAQCRNYLIQHFPGAVQIPVLSTADAAALVARENKGGYAAIGSARAAEYYSLDIQAEGIQDSKNQTRFIILGKGKVAAGKSKKTSLLFSVKNVAGSLFRVLQAFAQHDVNLTRIESRPARRQLGDYIFFVDLDGSPEDAAVKSALRQASSEAVMLKLLGSYSVLT